MPLPGSDKYRVVPVPRPMTWEQKIIEKARKEIRIEDVLSRYYDIYVPYEAVSWKVRCPYALEHEDGGLDKQFRIYSDSNNGYCFAMHGRVDNIRLYREIYPRPTIDVAKALLDDFEIDYRKRSYKETFEKIKQEKVFKADEEDIIEAMKLYLSSFPKYDDVQFDEDVVKAVQGFLDKVHEFCEQANNFEEVETWYLQQKIQIQSLLSAIF